MTLGRPTWICGQRATSGRLRQIVSSRRASFEAPRFSVVRGGWGPRRPEEVFARRRDLRRPCRWGISRREDFEVVGRGGDAWRKGSCPPLGAAPRHSLAVRRGSVLGGQAWLGPPGSGSLKWARADAPRLDKAVLCGAISAASSPTAPEEASNRPRTQDTGSVSHFARNQPGGVRPSSASPPSPHSPCLTGILTVLRLFGRACDEARSSLVPSGVDARALVGDPCAT